MPAITRKQALALLASFGPTAMWSKFSEHNGHGDYGVDETYSHAGAPVLKLSICFNPPSCKAYDLRKGV